MIRGDFIAVIGSVMEKLTLTLQSVMDMDQAETFSLEWYFFKKFFSVEQTFMHKYVNVHSELKYGMDSTLSVQSC